MPFDAADFDQQGDPRPDLRLQWLLKYMKNAGSVFVAISLTLLVVGLVGAATDGFPDLSLPDQNRTSPPPGFIFAQVVSTSSSLLIIGVFMWWRVRRFMAR